MTAPTTSIITTNQLIQLFLPLIQAGVNGIFMDKSGTQGPIVVKQAYQPTMQGVNTGPTVYLTKIGDHRYGFLGRIDFWDPDTAKMYHIENQIYETTFQISAWVISDPKNPFYTASDLVTAAALVMQNDATRAILNANGVGILRITDQRNPQFVDDRGFYEQSPSFDFTLTYTQSIVTVDPVITSTTLEIYPV
jgi:hypothetical protein